MKPTVMMITGWAHDAESMRPLADLLADQLDVRILTGAQVLAGGKIPDAEIVIGWSMGGMLAITHLPRACKKLILISSTAKFCAADSYDCGVPEKLLRRMIVQLKRDPDAVLTEFYKNVAHPHPAHTCASVKPIQEKLVAGLDYLLTADLRSTVPNIGIPVLLLHGEEDLIIPPAASDWLARHFPQPTLVRLPGEGHRPDALAIAPHIRHFLNPGIL